ncbi:MAG: superoxide dismutase family protein [Phycisphaeraceae bacterium]|nr:superoxide dismutase family protein [Phycisphaeraceae bacterium]
MRIRTFPLAALLILVAMTNTGCVSNHVTNAIAVMSPTQGSSVHGVVEFHDAGNGVRVVANISGLTPGDHGFHIHEWGDTSSADGTAAGGHFNPLGHQHGARDASRKHVGDLGNLHADAQGNATYDWTDPDMPLALIIGRGVIIHAKNDDYGQPTGNAGGRVAQGVIGVAKPDMRHKH